MKRIKPLLFLCLSLLLAAAAPGATLTPEEAAREALRHNRDLAVARAVIARAEARLIAAGLWSNPTFEAGAERGVRGADGERMVGLMQRFPLAGRLEKARRVARVDVAMAMAEYREVRRRLAGEVLGLARRGIALERKEAVLRENRKLLEAIRDQTTRLTATGGAAASDTLMAGLEMARLDLDLGRLEVEKQALHTRLNGLMGREPEAPLRLAGKLPALPSPDELRREAQAASGRRPDRQLALLRGRRARAEEILARARRWEEVGIGVDVMHEPGMETTVGLRISVPLPLWDRQQGAIAESRAAREEARAALAALDLAIATEIREAGERLQSLMALLKKAGGEDHRLARENTRLLEATYATGETPFLAVFEGRRQELALRLAAVELEEAWLAAYTEWETRTARFAPVSPVPKARRPKK